jgi:hypothetical protein
VSAKFTNRDMAVLFDVYTYRYLSVSQIERLHFPSIRTMQRRLKALVETGCLNTFTVPNISERIVYLDKAGAELVAGELNVEVDDLHWGRLSKTPKDYYFLRHFLAINDFRILLTKACQQTAINILGFIPEYIGEKTKQGVHKYVRDNVEDVANNSVIYSHTPDAVFALEKNGNSALFFLEIDRGGEVVADQEKGFLKCVVFYLHYWVSGKYQRYATDFGKSFKSFRALVITPSQKRLENMRQAVTNLPFTSAHAKRFLWATTEEKATRQTLFEPIWLSLDATDSTLYKIG